MRATQGDKQAAVLSKQSGKQSAAALDVLVAFVGCSMEAWADEFESPLEHPT